MGTDLDVGTKSTCDSTPTEPSGSSRSDSAPAATDKAEILAAKVEILKALVQDYTSARQEIVLHIQLYKTQERYGTVIVGVLGLLVPLLISGNITAEGWKDLRALGSGAVLFGLATISIVLFHMYFSTLANLFALQVLAERCVILQDQINDLLKGKYLFWERLTKLIWSKEGIPFHKMPDHMTGIFSFLLASGFGLFLPLYVLWNVFDAPQTGAFIFFAVIYLLCLFAAAILAVVNFVAMTRVRDECHHLFDGAIKSGRIFKDALYGNGSMVAWSNIRALVVIFSIAAGATAVFFAVVPRLLLSAVKHLGWTS